MRNRVLVLAAIAGAGCGSSSAREPAGAAAIQRVDESRYAPLEIGADYASYRRVTRAPFLSWVHGDRWVEVFVNEIGADAYLRGTAIPVGTIIVKSSWEGEGGQASSVPGPLYVMQKRAPGYAPEHGDWWYAMHWADPTPAQRAKLGGPIYWRGESRKVAYCYVCHDRYDRGLGGLVPSSLIRR